MGIGEFRRFPSARRPDYEPFLDEERFIDFLKSTLVLPHCSRNCICPDRTAPELCYYGPENLVVDGIEPPLVNIQGIKGISCYTYVNVPVAHDLGESWRFSGCRGS